MVNKNVSIFKPVESVEGLYIGKTSEKNIPVLLDNYTKNKKEIEIVGLPGEGMKNKEGK